LQINRAGISILSNPAEGSSRSSTKDYARFAEISLGSAFELETQLLIAKEVQYRDALLVETTLTMLADGEKMLTSFIRTLSDSK
jgi:four helix bundle protein